MVVRRIRGVLIAATVWGLASSLTTFAFTSALFLAGAGLEPMRRLPRELADLLPMTFAFGATAGALFALLILFAEQHHTLASLSEKRFRLWGIIAGALPIAAFEGITRIGHPHSSLISGVYAVFCGSFTGACFAPSILRVARHPAADSSADQSRVHSAVI